MLKIIKGSQNRLWPREILKTGEYTELQEDL